ncbi:N-6 DNA methylase, partial [Patescibacteria group bacterium]|nr:N-6 DNA methylase [Patescibacteria group bacterium]
MPSRTPQYYADIVIYENDDKKIPYIVVECKKDGISDAEFEQAVKQAIANDRVLKAPFAICVAGNTRRAIETEMWNDKEAEKYRFWHDFAQNNLFGIEINDSIARVAKMNMIIHDDGHTNVIGFDALENIEKMREKNRGFAKNCFDIIVTNPPFGANVKRSEHPYLEKFALGRKKDKKGKERALDNQKTEILFIERCIEFLKVGTGKMAIVLPDGILTNSSLQPVRDFLMERCRILAVVSLPQFAFTHFGAGVKSSLVFVRKKSESEESGRYPIFMAIAEHIGYDATGRKDAKNDLDEIYEEFKKFKGKNNL